MIYHEAPVYIVSPQHYLHGRIRLVCFDSSASGRTIYHKSIDSKEKNEIKLLLLLLLRKGD